MTIKGFLAILCVELLITQQPYALAQQPPPNPVQSQPQQALTPDQLDSLVAPIALYPDPILSQVLVASTYPLEIVEAARWLGQNSALQGAALTDAAKKQQWDASVQALVILPDLLKRLNQDISWTSDLGNAFLADQEAVMAAIQRLRQKAQSKGTLQSTKEQQVMTTSQGGNMYVEIQPASQQVVYIPEYNPEAVWGPPPEYYPYPPIYYPPVPSTGAVIAAGAISFGVGVAVGAIASGGWGGWGWHCGWGSNNVVINNNFINNNHFNRVNVGNGNTWMHSPAHRGGVPYSNANVANRFNGNRTNVNTRPTIAQTQQRLGQGPGNAGGNAFAPGKGNLGQNANGPRPNQGNLAQQAGGQIGQGNFKPSGDRVGNRTVSGNPGGDHGGGAFAGINQGGNRAQAMSNRGFASGGGGGFHGGGGGGGFRGGGGGSRGGGGRRR